MTFCEAFGKLAKDGGYIYDLQFPDCPFRLHDQELQVAETLPDGRILQWESQHDFDSYDILRAEWEWSETVPTFDPKIKGRDWKDLP